MYTLLLLVQNKNKKHPRRCTEDQSTFVTHSSPSCYVTLRTQVIRLNSGNLGSQKTGWIVFIIIRYYCVFSQKAIGNKPPWRQFNLKTTITSISR